MKFIASTIFFFIFITRYLDHIKQHKVEGKRIDYHVFFVPRRSVVCERVLEEEGVYGDVQISEYHLDLIPLDTDVLSFELPNSFKDIYVVIMNCLYNNI